VHQATRGSYGHHVDKGRRRGQRKSVSPLYPFKKNITKPLRRSARVQLRGGLGAANIENREVPPTVIVPDAVSEVATFIQLRQ